jgi:23S rRNA (cytosine1962-C5)-methyltransferase
MGLARAIHMPLLLAIGTSWGFSSVVHPGKRRLGVQYGRYSQSPHDHDAPHLQPLLESIAKCNPLGKDTNTNRVFHGRGGCFRGCEHLTLDWFPPVWVLTSFQVPLSEPELELVGQTLLDHHRLSGGEGLDDQRTLTWVYQCRGQLNVTTTLMAGEVPDPHVVTEVDCKYLVQTLGDSGGRRHRGIFLDMANGRQWVRHNAKDKKVLNLFSYTCAFSVAALKGGASEVINIDMAKGAIKVGQRNHELNNITTGARFLMHDIFKSWGKLRKLGPYDIILVDPPSYQKGSFVAQKDYAKVIRRLPDLLVPDNQSQVLLCLNAPELDVTFLTELVEVEAPQLRFVNKIENPSTFPSIDGARALKVLLYRYDQAVTVGME